MNSTAAIIAVFISGSLSHTGRVDGGYSEWGDWDDCTVTCGGGVQYRQRSCTNPPPSGGGNDCLTLGLPIESQPCNVNPCPGTLCLIWNDYTR